MIIINNLIQRAVFFEITIPHNEIINVSETRLLIKHTVKERSHYWARKTFNRKILTVKQFKIFSDVTVFNDGEIKPSIVITGHVYGGQTGKDVSGGDAYDAAIDFEEYIKTGTSPWIKQIGRDERSK